MPFPDFFSVGEKLIMPISGYFFAKFAHLTCLLESVQVKGTYMFNELPQWVSTVLTDDVNVVKPKSVALFHKCYLHSYSILHSQLPSQSKNIYKLQPKCSWLILFCLVSPSVFDELCRTITAAKFTGQRDLYRGLITSSSVPSSIWGCSEVMILCQAPELG